MKTIMALIGCSLAIAPAFAVKPCDELKTEIAAKLDAKGVKNYQLGIVAAADVKAETVVGSCDGGSKKITYAKGDQAPEKGAAQKDAAAPKGH
jgi:hypothetical protein